VPPPAKSLAAAPLPATSLATAPSPVPLEPAPEPTASTSAPSFAASGASMIPTPLAVPISSVVAPAPVVSARPRLDKKTDCAQPFTIDAKGVKIPKLHCL
jgi:hypothetical protein